MDYGPALPPRLGSGFQNTSDQNSNASEEPKKVSDRSKKTLTLTKGMKLNRGLPRMNTMRNPINLGSHLLNPKKHADKSRHKVKSRYVSSSSEEDQSSVAKHMSSKPS